jgi:transcriptional regulator with XRE-family HTH domain
MDTAHPLTRYRQRNNGMTLEAFAECVGATKSMVLKWERGAVPRRKYCERILQATNGEVTPSHFVFAAPASRQTEAA